MTHLLEPDDLIPDRALRQGDEDRFDHTAVAERVAELITLAPTPLNVGLFGTWGSGKSSIHELLRRKLPHDIALVYYDAWKYGGASLQRNFISHAATELGLPESDARYTAFHRGLYESSRTIDLSFDRFLKTEAWRILRLGGTTGLAVLGFAFLIALVTDLVFGAAALGELTRLMVGWAAPAAVMLATLVSALKLLDIARVDVERSAPSTDEQFSSTFKKLLATARDRRLSRIKRFVFFIDELDRCSPDDVVETLKAVRTFLDVPDCVFIVVADREVLEKALEELPQSNPTSVEAPYYSSASEFLEKIFQYQISLPPLRIGRLTGFAGELVRGRNGLWATLVDEGLLDKVLYALIPSHVRSPRRVKVLLNRFATNARIAEARKLDFPARAEEIAKLTVLETEFPAFAQALVIEPRLPEIVRTGVVPSTLPARKHRLVERFWLLPSEDKNESDEEIVALDRLLAKDGIAPVALRQREHLLRYLQRTSRVRDAGRDLLFLEPAGASFELDPDVGQFIEDLAPESPGAVLTEIQSLEDDQQAAAVRFLAHLVETEVGVERANVVETLLDAFEGIEAPPARASRDVATALNSFIAEQELNENQVAKAFRVGILANDRPLLRKITADDRLLAEPERVADVARHLEALDDQQRTLVLERLKEESAIDPTLLQKPLGTLSESMATELLEQVGTAPFERFKDIENKEAADGVRATAEALVESSPHQKVQAAVLWSLLNYSGTQGYQVVKDHVALVKHAESGMVSDSYALIALAKSPPGDWPLWADLLSDEGYRWSGQVDRTVRLLEKVFGAYLGLDGDGQRACQKIVQFASRRFEHATEEQADQVVAQIVSAFQGRSWWQNTVQREHQRSLHELAQILGSNNKYLDERIAKARLAELNRSVANPQIVTQDTLVGLRTMSAGLPTEAVRDLVGKLESVRGSLSSALMPEASRTEVALRGRMFGRTGELQESDLPPLDHVAEAVRDGSEGALEALDIWLSFGPPVKEAVSVAEFVTNAAPRKVASAFSDWMSGLSEGIRTDFLFRLWDRGVTHHEWIRAVQSLGVDEVKVTDALVRRIQEAPRAEQREELIDRLLALSPKNPKAQYRVGDLVENLLSTGKKVDFRLATRAFPALGTGHKSKIRIEQALRQASETTGEKLNRSQTRAVEATGVRPPKTTFTDRAWKFWKDLIS